MRKVNLSSLCGMESPRSVPAIPSPRLGIIKSVRVARLSSSSSSFSPPTARKISTTAALAQLSIITILSARMLPQLLAMYQPYVMGLRSALQYVARGLKGPSDHDVTTRLPLPNSHHIQTDSLSKLSPYGAPYMYKSLEAAANVLRLARDLEPRLSEDNALANEFFEELVQLEIFIAQLNRNKESVRMKFKDKQVVVFEGFHGSGKSTLSNLFISHYKSTLHFSVCDVWPEIRHICSETHEGVAVAFDLASCYFVSKQILEADSNQTILVENYYHWVCAQTACLEHSRDPRSLPEMTFFWPQDLPEPDLVWLSQTYVYLV